MKFMVIGHLGLGLFGRRPFESSSIGVQCNVSPFIFMPLSSLQGHNTCTTLNAGLSFTFGDFLFRFESKCSTVTSSSSLLPFVSTSSSSSSSDLEEPSLLSEVSDESSPSESGSLLSTNVQNDVKYGISLI